MLLEDDKHRWDAMGGEGGEVLVASTGERERTTLNEEEDGSTKTRLGAHYEGGPNELGCQGKGILQGTRPEKCDVPVLKPDLGKARKMNVSRRRREMDHVQPTYLYTRGASSPTEQRAFFRRVAFGFVSRLECFL